jgi:hypothetical protein
MVAHREPLLAAGEAGCIRLAFKKMFGHGLPTDKPNWTKSDQIRLTCFVILQLISDAQTATEIEPLVLLLHYCRVDVIWNMFFAKKRKVVERRFVHAGIGDEPSCLSLEGCYKWGSLETNHYTGTEQQAKQYIHSSNPCTYVKKAKKRARLTWRQECVVLVAKDDLPVSTSSPRIIIVSFRDDDPSHMVS